MRDPIGESLVCGALWMGEVQLVGARGMPVCMKRKGAPPEGEGSVTMCRHFTRVCALTAIPKRAWLFGIAVRVQVWHPVDPGSSPGVVTTLSLRYIYTL